MPHIKSNPLLDEFGNSVADASTVDESSAFSISKTDIALTALLAGGLTLLSHRKPKQTDEHDPKAKSGALVSLGSFVGYATAFLGAMVCMPTVNKYTIRPTITRDGDGAVTGVSNDTLLGKAVHLLARHVGGGTPEENALKIGGMVKPEHLVGAALMGTGTLAAGVRSFAGRVSHDRSSAGGAERH
jgi:hypothetical protein